MQICLPEGSTYCRLGNCFISRIHVAMMDYLCKCSHQWLVVLHTTSSIHQDYVQFTITCWNKQITDRSITYACTLEALIKQSIFLNPVRTEVHFCHQNQNADIIGYLRLYWNPITLALIWKVLRQAFRWYYYFWNPSTFGWVRSLFAIFSKYLQYLGL
jgi:hypothetical protein